MRLTDGKYEMVRDVLGVKHPLKIVVSVKDSLATVVTNYPLKKGKV